MLGKCLLTQIEFDTSTPYNHNEIIQKYAYRRHTLSQSTVAYISANKTINLLFLFEIGENPDEKRGKLLRSTSNFIIIHRTIDIDLANSFLLE